MTDRLSRLAELFVHGANVQDGQIVLVSARDRPRGAGACDRRAGLEPREKQVGSRRK